MTSIRPNIRALASIKPSARPVFRQVAALCLREKDGKAQVLMVTSRATRRWIIPKGWPIDGTKNPKAALIEAWEEAGVKQASVSKKPIAEFASRKRLHDGTEVRITTDVFRVKVDKTEKSFPERDQRRRKWMHPAKAAKLVQENGLKKILRAL